MMKRLATVLLVGACVSSLAVLSRAQGGSKKIAIGDPAPNFSGLPGIDGKPHSLAEYSTKDVLVLCVTCNHCPVAVQYETRLVNFAKRYATGAACKVGFVAICVDAGEDDSLEKMKERAKEQGFNFPYLRDESQRLGRQLNAKVTPEFYVFNKERKLVYTGAMDNNNDPSQVTINYLDPAVDATLKGQTPATAQTRARGCAIEYQRK
jgi:peroxiredoxin